MKKTLSLLTILFLLNGCAESVALLGTTAGGASSGRMVHSSLHTVTSYGIKKQTGKTPLGHALAYAEKANPPNKKEPCLSFIEKSNSKVCEIMKKKISITKDKIINKQEQNKSLKKLSLSTQSSINKKSKIKYLD
ncbi:hypothetical protein N8016_01030 [Pelagibacteraceae bacterium]|nr:hypothetical protein [Pelagibacteraceae bacterium]|tara:strand:- start:6 stop:410 length:405 start_codon:yes stop_codon:yes gene_type:complete